MNDLFESINAKPTNSWLKEQTENHLDQHEIFDFFLNNDLRITSESIIDPNIFIYEDYVLSSNILVQIDEIIDISIPFSKRKEFIVNSSTKRRTFKFLLSDGHFQFAAISKDFLEFDPRIVPGIKIKILSGTELKFGILLLKKDKLKIIGGQSLELRSKRHSIVLYDEKRYKEQQMQSNSLDSFVQQPQQKTKKKKNASLIITKEDENKGKTRLPKNKNSTKQSINEISIEPKVINQSFLNDDSSFNSDDIIEKVESKELQKVSSNSDELKLDQISFSSYSSDVEIINSINEKHEKDERNKVQQGDTQKKIQNRRFLSDDDDLDDFDFDYLLNNKNDDHEKSTNDFYQPQKIWTISELLKKERMLKNASYSSNPEIILLDGRIIECNELKVIQKKNSIKSNLFFSMKCKIASDESTMEMNVASRVINNLLDSTPEVWMDLDYNEQIRKYEECSRNLLSFKSPLSILSTGIFEPEIKNRFFIVNDEFLSFIKFDK